MPKKHHKLGNKKYRRPTDLEIACRYAPLKAAGIPPNEAAAVIALQELLARFFEDTPDRVQFLANFVRSYLLMAAAEGKERKVLRKFAKNLLRTGPDIRRVIAWNQEEPPHVM